MFLLGHRQKGGKVKMFSQRMVKPLAKQPTYGCQVTIVSEQEHQLQKMFHKEDKKMLRREKGGKHLQEDMDKETYLASKGFMPEAMRQERCVCSTCVYSTKSTKIEFLYF